MSILDQLKSKSSFSKLLEAVEAIKSPESGVKNYKDDRVWSLSQDKAGNGSALIRFLPAPEGEDLPFIKIFKHAFSYQNGVIQPQGQKGGRWYIENSLSTFGQQDIVGEENAALWNTGVEANKEIARKRKRTLNYYSNILVINDPEHPENNNKVFLFKYGKAIFDIISLAMNPPEVDALDDDDEQAVAINPFCFWQGADLALRIAKKDGWPSYHNSEFRKPKALFKGDEEKLEEVWKKEYSLQELLDPKHFKTYDELKKRFLEVTTSVSVGNAADLPDVVKFVDEPEDDIPLFETPAPKVKLPKQKASVIIDDEDDLDFFTKLANGD